jgi:hypothetical protein
MVTKETGPAGGVFGGSCLCGRVRYRATEPFLDMLHCHCPDCRKTHGAAFATSIGVARDRWSIVEGAGDLEAWAAPSGTRRSFCRHCGSKIAVDNDAWDAIYVPAGTLDEDPPHRPQLHMFVRSKAAWHDILDDLPRYEAGPEDDYRSKVPPLRR